MEPVLEKPLDEEQEKRKKKKREEEERWKKILAYYMMQREQLRAEGRLQEMEDPFAAAYFERAGFESLDLFKIFSQPDANGVSLADRLERLSQDEKDGPFRDLWEKMNAKPASKREVAKALERVIRKEPPRMLKDARRERDRRAEFERAHEKEEQPPEDTEAIRYNQRLNDKLAIMSKFMAPELFRELVNQLERAGRMADMEGPVQEQKAVSYDKYVESKCIDLKVEKIDENAARLANRGDVYGAAAYVLAAWEQKDAEVFDPEKADARAMELSGSRAFRVYMDGHPGSLIAAARNTGLEVTHGDITALEKQLDQRDAILAGARDALKKMEGIKSKHFDEMLNALDRFVNLDEEPSEREKNGLVNALGKYVLTDCAPGAKNQSRACFTQAMRSLKVLLPEQTFSDLVNKVNLGRVQKVRERDFDPPAERKKPSAEKSGPEQRML